MCETGLHLGCRYRKLTLFTSRQIGILGPVACNAMLPEWIGYVWTQNIASMSTLDINVYQFKCVLGMSAISRFLLLISATGLCKEMTISTVP